MPESIPECHECNTQLNNIRRLASADWINTEEFHSLIDNAHLAAEQCYEACNYILSDGGSVLDSHSSQSLERDDIENRLRQRKKELEGYRRVSQNLPFSYWAGGTLDNHENTPTPSQSFNEELNFIYNRHTVSDHIRLDGKALGEMIDSKSLLIASSFHTRALAEWAIARILAFYWDDVSAWLELSEDKVNRWTFIGLDLPTDRYSFNTGRDIGQSRFYNQSKLFIATHVRMILVRDSSAPRGFWIKSAFPSPA